MTTRNELLIDILEAITLTSHADKRHMPRNAILVFIVNALGGVVTNPDSYNSLLNDCLTAIQP